MQAVQCAILPEGQSRIATPWNEFAKITAQAASMTTVPQPDIASILSQFRTDLAAARTLKRIEMLIDWAFSQLPIDAAEANTAVIHEAAKRRREL